MNGRWFKFDPAASPPRWNVVRPTAPANNQANVLEFDPAAWMTELPNYQAWANVINSVPMYSTMGTSPAVVSSPPINPRPLVETMEDEEENTVGELAAAAEMVNETLTASSATTNLPHLLPSQPPTLSPNATINVIRIVLVNKLFLRIMSSPRLILVLLNTPACSNRGRLKWKPKRAAKRERFQKRMHHYHDTHRTTHIGQPRTKRDHFLKCMRHFRDTHCTSPRVSRTPWRPSAPTSRRISHSEPSQNCHLGLTPLFWVSAFSNLFAGC